MIRIDTFISGSYKQPKDRSKLNLLAELIIYKMNYQDYFIAYDSNSFWFYDGNNNKITMTSKEVYDLSNEIGAWDLVYGFNFRNKKRELIKEVCQTLADNLISDLVSDLNFYPCNSEEYKYCYERIDNPYLFLLDLYTSVKDFISIREDNYLLRYNNLIVKDCNNYFFKKKYKYITDILTKQQIKMSSAGDESSPKIKKGDDLNELS